MDQRTAEPEPARTAHEEPTFSALISSGLRAVHGHGESQPRPAVESGPPAAPPSSSESEQEQCAGGSPVVSSPASKPPPHPPAFPPPTLPLPSPPLGPAGPPPRKKNRGNNAKHSNVEVVLEGKSLWEEFCRRGTEMIVNRAGRRMFPGFAVTISGLKPKVKYSMKLVVILVDNHRFKFLNGRWLAVGTAEPQHLSDTYLHPDSPNSGAFWMRHGVSFRKLKITNNKEKPGGNVLLHSMHKYSLRLLVDEERRTPPGEEKTPARNILAVDFPETSFIAVTAYQNEEVTQLKISNNPFAKAFRENASDIDWETAQMIYGNPVAYSPAALHGDHYGIPSGQFAPPGSWPLPLTPPTSHTSHCLPPPISPLPGITPTHPTSYFSPSHFRADSAPQCFTWPPAPHHRPHIQPSTSYEPHPSVPSFPQPLSHPAAISNLPDFDSVFTSS